MLILAQFINLATTSFEKQEQTFDRVLIFFIASLQHFCRKSGVAIVPVQTVWLWLCKSGRSVKPHCCQSSAGSIWGNCKAWKKTKILTPNCAIMIDDVSSITALRGITFLYQRNTVLPSRRRSSRQSTLNDNISLLTDRYYSSQLEPVDATVSTAISLASSGSSSGHHSATSSGSHSDSRGGTSPGGHSPQAGKWLAIQSIGWLIEWVLLKQYDQHSQRCHLRIFSANPTFIKQNSNDWSPVIIIDIFLIMSSKFKQVEI